MQFLKQLMSNKRRPSGNTTAIGGVKNYTPKKKLYERLQQVVYHPHPECRTGSLTLTDACFESEDRDCNLCISRQARIDCTADVTIGAWTEIGGGTRIFTHDHFLEGRDKPLLLLQEEKGVWWSDLVIGSDVWLAGCTVLAQVTEIPDGVVVGAGSILTKNPGPYEVWAGSPARKIRER